MGCPAPPSLHTCLASSNRRLIAAIRAYSSARWPHARRTLCTLSVRSRAPYLRRWAPIIALGAEHAEALVLRGQRLLPIERHEVERTRIVLRRRESRAELQRIGGPQGVTRDEPLGVAPDDLDRGDFRPAIPRGEELPSRALQPPGRAGFLSPAAGESGEQL